MAGRRRVRGERAAAEIHWSRLGELDLESAHALLRAVHPEAAKEWATAVLDAVDRLAAHPQVGPVARDLRPTARYRHLVVGMHRIIYRLEGEKLWILRVWEARRDPDSLKPE